MRRLKLMRKGLVLAALLLILALLPAAPMAVGKKGGKPGPTPKEKASVTASGADIEISGTATLDVYRFGKLVTLTGHADVVFKENLYSTEFEGTIDVAKEEVLHENGRLSIRVDKTSGDVSVYYGFERYQEGDEVDDEEVEERYWGLLKYELETSGEWSDQSVPYGTVTVDESDCTISQMIYHPSSKKGKSATSVEYRELWTGISSFTISINPFIEG